MVSVNCHRFVDPGLQRIQGQRIGINAERIEIHQFRELRIPVLFFHAANNKTPDIFRQTKFFALFDQIAAVIFFVGKAIWTSDMGLGNALLATSLGNVGAFLARLCIFSWVF